MNLESKIDEAQNLVHKVLAQAKTPAIMSSFGKDSMVMLHLIRSLKRDLPIVFYRESFMPKKYRFANAVIDEWDLTVYDYSPFRNCCGGKKRMCRGYKCLYHREEITLPTNGDFINLKKGKFRYVLCTTSISRQLVPTPSLGM
jgi:hypothetical protein